MEIEEERRSVPQVLYETRHHASRPYSSSYPPVHQQLNEGAKGGFLRFLSTQGLSEFIEKWTTNKLAQKLSKWISMFISPSGEHVAIAVGNEITILQRDDNYQEPCGIFTCSYPITYTFGAWSEDHGVLGVFDNTDTLYFIKANGEEITRITKQHLKVPLPIISFVIQDDKNAKKSCLCTFSILASDGSVHDIEISQDPSASISTINSSNIDTLLQKKFPQNISCCGSHPDSSLFAVVSNTGSITSTSTISHGSYSMSLWKWHRQSGLQQVSSVDFEGLYTKTKGYTDQMSLPKILFSPQGEYIATLDLRGCLIIYKLDKKHALSLVHYKQENDLKTISDFTWWDDHIIVIATRNGNITMIDIQSGIKVLQDDSQYSLPVLERVPKLSGCVFILESKNFEPSDLVIFEPVTIERYKQFESGNLQWSLVSFAKRSVEELYDIFISGQQFRAALELADRHGLDKDEVLKAQWLCSSQGLSEINKFLSVIKDQDFVLSECLDRVGPTEDAVRGLIAYGINLTNRYVFSDVEDEKGSPNWDFRLARLKMLQYRDRLETFIGINMGRYSTQDYSKFRSQPIQEAAITLAESCKIGALNLLFKRHPFSISPSMLQILSSIPETVPVQNYTQLLPNYTPPHVTPLREQDWVESKTMVNYISTLPQPDTQIQTEPIVKQLTGFTWPLRDEICKWYKDRAREMDMFSGQLDNSLTLIDFGFRKGVKELEDFKTLVSYLHELIYSCDDNDVSFTMSLTTWEELSDYEKFKLMLKGYNEENVIKKLRDSAVPFMEKKYSPSDDVADSVDSFLVRWMKEVAMENKIEVCLVVIEEGCDFFRSEGEVVDCTLRCLYFFTVTDRWSIMEAMLSKLPYLHGSEYDDLKKRLKVAEGHVEAGRLLTFYQVPKPIAFFLEAQSDSKSVKQILRLILSKFIRRQPGRTDNDWANMWRDFQSLQEKAFPFVDLEYMLMEYCRGLLKAGKFSLARNYLKGSGSLVLPTDKAENIVILAAREYFFSASSLSCSEIWKAKECLNILPTSRTVTIESDIIEALTVKLPQLGVTILPLQYRQIKDPMEILKLAITTQPNAYLHVTDLIDIAKLLGLNSHHELSRVHELIAREAAVAGDLQLAFDLSLLMIKKGHAPIWDLCTALARGPALENMDVNSRKHLLGFALSHCDKESVGELLHAWKDLDMVSQCEKVSALTGSNPLVNENHEQDLGTLKKTLSHVSTCDSDEFKENGKVVSFLSSRLPWLIEVSREGSGRLYGMVAVLMWLGRNDLGVKDEWIGEVAKVVMEGRVTEEEDVMGCAVLLNLNDAFYGVEVIEAMVKGREDYEEACSMMNLGMIYSLLHNSRGECEGPEQRRELLLRKFQEKYSSLSSDERNKIDQAQSSFWREWKLKLEEQKRVADHTRAIEQIVPGIETSRFLSGDINYMETVIFSFIETIKTEKKKILKDVMKLSSDYGLDQTKVLQKFLSTSLLSDIWTIDEIKSELSQFETIILNHPKEIFTTISESIYPSINGQNKRHLSYIYHLLSITFPLIPQKQDLITTDLDNFYTTMEQECLKLQSIKDLDFKNIATLTGPNLSRVTNEVYAHVNEETVETLADTMKTLTGIYRDRVPEGLVPYPYIYGYYVSTSLTSLENNAKSTHHFQTPENLKSFIKSLEVTYDKCKKYIKLIAYPGASVMGIMKKFFKITPLLNTGFDHLQDPKWKDDLILLLKFWLRLINDLKQFVSSNDLEPKFSPDCLSICLESFMELVNDESIPTSDAWAAIFSYINFGLVGDVYTEILNFCRSMMFSGCRFKAIACVYNSAISKFPLDANLSDEIRRHYEDISDLSHLYLRILETILKDLGNGSQDHKNLYRVLSSLSELEGDLDALKKVRTVIWDRLGKFSDDMEIPSHVRVHLLEVMQFITFTNSTSSIELQENVIPWDGWGNMGISTSNTPKATDSSNRFTNTLIALKSTQLLSKISPDLEVSPNDLSTTETAVSCFLNLSENALSRPHIDVLMAVLGEWEGLFGKLTVKEEIKNPAETPAADWGNDDWDEGWEVDEDLVEKETKKDENTLKIHALHQCWAEIFKKLISLSQFTDILRIIDASKPKQNGVLLNEESARELTQSLLKVDCYLAVKIAVLLPYEKLHSECLTAVEDKLKEKNIPTDYGFLVCLLGSGLLPTIITKPCYKNVHLYLNYLMGSWCKEGEVTVFRRVILPWYLSELVKGDQVMLVGLIVVKIMGVNCSFGLVNVAEVCVRKFLERFVEKEVEVLGDELEVEFCEGLVNTVAGLRSGVVDFVKEALEVLS